ncbi:hypothetical protein [Goekera deserti]|uniref:hypothetical protein n=1 Tax=Goekera deserti TaxID=2497753 RepID=UPI00192E7D23|nr:hypothetical protein [Goekera deserti]
MALRNHLVDGVSCSGKTSVCRELQRRGLHAINGDTELAYQGDPVTGHPTETATHDNHTWDVARVESIVADRRHRATYFCGGARNSSQFLHLFDTVFVLHVNVATLQERLDRRPADEFGGRPAERDLVLRLHRTGEGSRRASPSMRPCRSRTSSTRSSASAARDDAARPRDGLAPPGPLRQGGGMTTPTSDTPQDDPQPRDIALEQETPELADDLERQSEPEGPPIS